LEPKLELELELAAPWRRVKAASGSVAAHQLPEPTGVSASTKPG
jgi:hypothetical protein